MLRAACLGILLCTPLVAEEFSIDGHLIDRCLAIHDNPMVCVGRQADACALANGNGPNMALAACFQAEFEFWDAALNVAYSDLKRLADDLQSSDVGYPAGALRAALKDMQLAWIDYRDATCAHKTAIVFPFGSAAGPADAECKMRQTARQYFELRRTRQAYLP